MLSGWAPLFTEVVLVPAAQGRFEVTLDDELLYSKLATGRHVKAGEVANLLTERIGPPVMP